MLTYLGHATVLVEAGGIRILTDPVLTARVAFLRRVPDALEATAHHGVEVVLVSHLHHDHLHLPSLRLLGAETRMVVPRGAEAILSRRGFRNVEGVSPGDVVTHGGARITVTEAAHDDRRRPWGGPRATPVGYLVEADGTSTYFAGDTDLFDAMADLDPDVALLPVWGWGPNVGQGHLDPEGAAEALERLGARYAVPIHWGTLFPHRLERIAPHLLERLERPPHRFAEHAARLGCRATVLVTAPGERVQFEPQAPLRPPPTEPGIPT